MTHETFVADFCCATLLHNKSLQLQPAKRSCNKTRNKHVVSDTDDDVIIIGVLLAGAIVKEQKRKKAKTRKRSVWIWT